MLRFHTLRFWHSNSLSRINANRWEIVLSQDTKPATMNKKKFQIEPERVRWRRERERDRARDGKKHAQMKNPTWKVKNGCNYSMSVILMPFFQNSALIDKITIPVNVRVCDITFFFFVYGSLFASLLLSCSLLLSRHLGVNITFFVRIQLIIQRWAETKNLHGVRFHVVFDFYGWFFVSSLTLWAA